MYPLVENIEFLSELWRVSAPRLSIFEPARSAREPITGKGENPRRNFPLVKHSLRSEIFSLEQNFLPEKYVPSRERIAGKKEFLGGRGNFLERKIFRSANRLDARRLSNSFL